MPRKLTHHEESTNNHQQHGSRSRYLHIRHSSRDRLQARRRAGRDVRRGRGVVSPGKVTGSVLRLHSCLVSSRWQCGRCPGGIWSRGRVALWPRGSISVIALLDVEESHRAETLASKSITMKDSIPRKPVICIFTTVLSG
jgi:hypothetical protein